MQSKFISEYNEYSSFLTAAVPAAIAAPVAPVAPVVESFEESDEVLEWINTNTSNFALSLRGSIEEWGRLTDNQRNAVKRAIEQDKNKVMLDLTRINELFENAKASGLQRPVLRLAEFAISLAPITGVNAGCLYVKSGEEYLGKITSQGKFLKVNTAPDDTGAKLTELALDPRSAAVAYGRKTGQCSCCGRQLTNADSIELGIGPICLSKWGF